MKRCLAAIVAACLLLLAGCGGGPHARPPGATGPTGTAGVTSAPLAAACPPGRSFMGCAAPHQVGTARNVGIAPAGCKFPDVSVFQGHPNWAAVRSWQLAAHCPVGAVFKLGEYVVDQDASYNATTLHALGMVAIGYWFVRNTGCAHESAQIGAIAGALGIHVVALDMEVPEAAGYAPCLSSALHAAGITALIYTGPGTWPGGSNAGLPFWEANYGPSSILSVPSMFGERPIAWQETDGHFGFPVDVPGIGDDDVSIDFGLLRLAAPAPPKPKPDPYAIFPAKKILLFGQRVSERNTVATWWSHGCSNPVHREVCKTTRVHLVWLAGRLELLAEQAAIRNSPAQPTHRYDWKPDDWGDRKSVV